LWRYDEIKERRRCANSRPEPEAKKAIDGLPMEMESTGSKTTVTKLERKPTPASEFEPPAGYKKVPRPF